MTLSVVGLAGCSSVRVRVDSRAATEPEYRERLLGPRYVIRGPDEQAEASLAFQAFAATWSYALETRRPDLVRVEPTQPADFAILLHVQVVNLGGTVAAYPVYGSHFGPAYGPWGPGHYRTFGVVGTEVRSVHFGYDHVLFATAYIQDPAGPGGRRVLWEGMAGSVSNRMDLDEIVPFLAVGLTSTFGDASEGTRTFKFSRRDDEVKLLRRAVRSGQRPVEVSPELQDENDADRASDGQGSVPG